MRTLSALIIGISLAYCPTSRADTPIQRPVAVPFEVLVTKHIAVRIKVNGKGPYRVIFDTGAPISLISSKVAKESGLASGSSNSFFSLGSMFGGVLPPRPKLSIETLRPKMPVIIMDHPMSMSYVCPWPHRRDHRLSVFRPYG